MRTRARTCQRAFSVIASTRFEPSKFEVSACAECDCVRCPGEASLPAPPFCMLTCELPGHASRQCDFDRCHAFLVPRPFLLIYLVLVSRRLGTSGNRYMSVRWRWKCCAGESAHLACPVPASMFVSLTGKRIVSLNLTILSKGVSAHVVRTTCETYRSKTPSSNPSPYLALEKQPMPSACQLELSTVRRQAERC